MATPLFLLQETGDYLFQENGDKIILDRLYFISGLATLSGAPVENAKVTLIDSDTDLVVDTQLTDADGYYIFDGLDVAKTYHCIAEYDDGVDKWNAKSLPYLTPER